ncbi:MAG: hypothetical protein ABIG64_06845 [Candidatus Omnitrophota bacterium]
MFEVLEKIILAGVGLANLTKEKAEALVELLITKGQIKAKDKKAVLNRLLKGTKKLDQELEKKIKNISLNVVKNSQKQIDNLNKKLVILSEALEREKKKVLKIKNKKT